MIPVKKRSAALRAAIEEGVVVAPGAFNALVARAIERRDFGAVYLSGAAISNCVRGIPDVGFLGLVDVIGHARRISEACDLPLIADIDTGFGGPEQVQETIRAMGEAGVSAVHIEDQRLPKRCGHLSGKEIVDTEEMVEKIRAAVQARPHKDFLILARTDAGAVEGFEGAVRRAQWYLEAGADGIFPEALESEEQFACFAREVPTILLANMTEFGKSPPLPVARLAELGYKIAIFPMTLARAAMFAVEQTLDAIEMEGTSVGMLDRMQTRAELYDLLDYDPEELTSRSEKDD